MTLQLLSWPRANGTGATPPSHVIVFLLGYANSGTSAVHWLIGQAPAVSTLRPKDIFGSKKEGWALDGLKRQASLAERWRDDDGWIPWEHLKKTYYDNWNLSKPILLESSPPEILHSDHLFQEFGARKDTEVRFVVLVRSPCNQHATDNDDHAGRMTVVRAIAEQYGRRHAFILRYEDLCASPYLVPPALDKWLPGLGAGINIGQAPAIKNQRRRYLSEKHEKMSIPDYCNTRFIPYLPYNATLAYRASLPYHSLLSFFNYAAVTAE